MKLNLIVAYDKNFNIGKENKLPWKRIKYDMAYFRMKTTQGRQTAVIMGRKTFESIGKKALLGRLNIVVSQTLCDFDEDHASIVTTFANGVQLAEMMGCDVLWVVGGEGIYKTALNENKLDEIHVTELNESYEGCDTKFPIELVYERYKTKVRSDYHETISIFKK